MRPAIPSVHKRLADMEEKMKDDLFKKLQIIILALIIIFALLLISSAVQM